MPNNEQRHHFYLNNYLNIPSDFGAVFNTTQTLEGYDAYLQKQKNKYGFDMREVLDLNFTLLSWLYSHLHMFRAYCFDQNASKLEETVPLGYVLVEKTEEEREKEGVDEEGFYFFRIERQTMSVGDALNLCIESMEGYLKGLYKQHQDLKNGTKRSRDVEMEANKNNERARYSMLLLSTIFLDLWTW